VFQPGKLAAPVLPAGFAIDRTAPLPLRTCEMFLAIKILLFLCWNLQTLGSIDRMPLFPFNHLALNFGPMRVEQNHLPIVETAGADEPENAVPHDQP
jgi:hypothetical protein